MTKAKIGPMGAAALAASMLVAPAPPAAAKPQPVASKSYSEKQRSQMDKLADEQAARAAWLQGMRAALSPEEKAYNESRQAHALERASSHPSTHKRAYYRKYNAHTIKVLEELEDVDLALSKMVPLDMLHLIRPGEMSLSQRGNMLMYMLTAFHEERSQGVEGMAAVTQVLKNRVGKEYRKAETPLAQLALLAQFTYIGETPLEKLTNTGMEPKSWRMAAAVGYAQAKSPEMAFTKGFITEADASKMDEVATALNGCMDYHTTEAEKDYGRAMNHLANGGGVVYIGNQVYLLPLEQQQTR